MRRSDWVAVGVAAAAALGVAVPAGQAAEAKVPPPAEWRGVNDAGGEFGEGRDFCNARPGKYDQAYHFSGLETLRYFHSRGMNVVRTPFRWERLQPRLGQELEKDEVARIRDYLERARQAGVGVILDMHNYARYRRDEGGKVVDAIIDDDAQVTRQQFADFWRRAAEAFGDRPALWAYGLCNEPHDLKGADWKAISQAAVDGIRKVDKTRWILVAGNSWSNAEHWAQVNGPSPWIKDPADKIAYEGHLYLDQEYSGTYRRSYDEELQKDPALAQRGSRRIKPFIEWCKANKAVGFLGEFGVPDKDPRWLELLKDEARTAQEGGIGWTYWAAGEWWGGYPLSIQPKEGKDRPQMEALLPLLK